jgi:periplasmic protein TonB
MTQALSLALLLASQTAATPPAAPPRATDWPFRLFSSDDYPARALRGEEEGRVAYRIRIGPDGRVSQCDIRVSSGSAALDDTTCRIVRARARFAPARDSQGHAVPDAREGEVFWRLPRPEPAPE